MGEDALDAPPPPMPDVPDFDRRARLNMERETTGVYISGHPLDEYADALSKLQVNARFLESLAEDSPDHGLSWDRRMVRMGGLITGIKQKATKGGGMMAFVQLEDLYGSTEVLVFPKVYERCGSQLVQDAAVAMSGRLSVREDEPAKLLMERVVPLEQLAALEREDGARGRYASQASHGGGVAAPPPETFDPAPPPEPYDPAPPAGSYAPRRPARRLYLRLNSDQREAVLRILAETPGDICVMLYIADQRKTYQAPRRCWVDSGYDFGALAKLLGADSIVLKE